MVPVWSETGQYHHAVEAVNKMMAAVLSMTVYYSRTVSTGRVERSLRHLLTVSTVSLASPPPKTVETVTKFRRKAPVSPG